MFNIWNVELACRLLVFNRFSLLICDDIRFSLVNRLFSSTVGDWIWTWAYELRPLWWVSRFLTMTAIFNCWTSVICINFTYDNFIFIICCWSFITFCPPLIFNLTPRPVVFVCSSCCGICWLLSAMVLKYQLILDWCWDPVFLLNIELVDWISCSYFRVFCTWIGCLFWFILVSRCWSLLAGRWSLPFL